MVETFFLFADIQMGPSKHYINHMSTEIPGELKRLISYFISLFLNWSCFQKLLVWVGSCSIDSTPQGRRFCGVVFANVVDLCSWKIDDVFFFRSSSRLLSWANLALIGCIYQAFTDLGPSTSLLIKLVFLKSCTRFGPIQIWLDYLLPGKIAVQLWWRGCIFFSRKRQVFFFLSDEM